MKYLVFGLLLLVITSCVFNSNTKGVTRAFANINEELGRQSYTAKNEYQLLFKELEAKAKADPNKYGKVLKRVKKMGLISDSLYLHIAVLKEELTQSIKDPEDYAAMDASSVFDTMMFAEKGLTKNGQSFLDLITFYKKRTTKYVEEYPSLESKILNSFSIGNRSRTKNFLEYEFQGFPLIASLTKLTQLQADIVFIKEVFLKNQRSEIERND